MTHVWAQQGLPDSALTDAAERERFVYWFYDTYHRARAPYRLAIPQEVLRWLNTKTFDLTDKLPGQAGSYLTRYMMHVLESRRRDFDLARLDGYVRFLC